MRVIVQARHRTDLVAHESFIQTYRVDWCAFECVNVDKLVARTTEKINSNIGNIKMLMYKIL